MNIIQYRKDKDSPWVGIPALKGDKGDKGDMPDLTGYATTDYVDEAVGNVDIPDVDLTGYAKLTDIPSLDGYAKTEDIPEIPTKVSAFANDVGYLTQHQDISGKADKAHTHKLADITDYVAPDLSGFATEDYVKNAINEAEINTGDGNSNIDLSAYALKSDIPTVPTNVSVFANDAGYATEDYVDAAIATVEVTGGGGVGASGTGSHAEIFNSYTANSSDSNRASGEYSHAEGCSTTASGSVSHAEGNNTTASGSYSHAEGNFTSAMAFASHSEGYMTSAQSICQHVQGRYNIIDKDGVYLHIVGNGTYTPEDSIRSNAHTLDWDGNAWYAGTVESTALILASPNGTRYKITVGDTGTLSAAAL